MENVYKEPCGLLIINKHKGVTSHDIVNKIRKLYGTRRVGHTGTLDPLATGVLVVLVGRAAKAAEYLVADEKKYRAVMRLGVRTDTEDITGKVLSEKTEIPTCDKVSEVLTRFAGNIMQIPPMYSALKVGGKKLVDIAREGKTVERAARSIFVYSLEAAPTDVPSDYILSVHCSSGTYIRTLCADIGDALGCGATMVELERREAGGFSIENAYTVEKIEKMPLDERMKLLMPTENLFFALKKVTLDGFYERLSRNGCEIYQKKIKTDLAIGERVRMYTAEDKFYALGEVREFSEGTAIKAVKLFELE